MMMKKTAVTASPKVALSWPFKVFALSYSSKDGYPWYPIFGWRRGQEGWGESTAVFSEIFSEMFRDDCAHPNCLGVKPVIIRDYYPPRPPQGRSNFQNLFHRSSS